MEKEDLLKRIAELETELARIKNIKPICANCYKIRDDKVEWIRPDVFFNKIYGIEFSHGICPKCSKELYPELQD